MFFLQRRVIQSKTGRRIFHIQRDKLMTIPTFRLVYDFIVNWLNWLKNFPPWQAIR